MREIISQMLIKEHIPRFSDFASIKLHAFSDLEKYFRKKIEIS